MKRWFGVAAVVLGLAAWYVPQISAARFREPIRKALESALGRKVNVGAVEFRVVPLPGFTVHEVVIGEDPAIGPEPVAYVTTLRARPRLSVLFGGALEFASVDLEDTSLNLTRVDRGENEVRWNFSSLMRPNPRTAFPSIHMIGGRINFKFGDTKSIFYLLNTDVDLWPPSQADGPWTVRVRALPARTDRPARGFGSFTARGQWMQREKILTLDVKLEKSELGDLLTLVQGGESGLHGHMWGDAHLSGPLSRVGLTGRLTVDDIHGWNQPPPPGVMTWPLAIGGSFDVPGQIFEVRATATGRQSPFDLRYRVTDYLGRPRWATTVLFSGMPVSPAFGIARSLGVNIPADLSFNGSAQGAVGYSMSEGGSGSGASMNGQVQITGSTLQVDGDPPLRIADAQLRFAGSAITLGPAAITNASDETAMLQGSYDAVSKRLRVSLSTEGMSIVSLRRQISVAGAPLLGQATSGTWSGNLQYTRESEARAGEWTGEFHLEDADIPFEAFNQPLHVLSADAAIDESGIGLKRLNLSIAGIAVQGEYRYEPSALRPHRFRISAARANGEALEKLLLPTLHRGTFLNYAFNFGRVPEPDWLRAMRADGTVQAGALDLGSQHFTKIRTHVLWDGDEIHLTALQGQLDRAVFTGEGMVELAQRQPQYSVNGKISGLPWRSGTLEADGSLKASGTGAQLLSNMTAEGGFRARSIDLAPLETWDTIVGRFDWAWNSRNPRLRLTELVMATAGDTYTGTAETQDNGQLVLRISDGARNIQAAGALLRGDDLKLIGQ
jgi:hypothetical protein